MGTSISPCHPSMGPIACRVPSCSTHCACCLMLGSPPVSPRSVSGLIFTWGVGRGQAQILAAGSLPPRAKEGLGSADLHSFICDEHVKHLYFFGGEGVGRGGRKKKVHKIRTFVICLGFLVRFWGVCLVGFFLPFLPHVPRV